jgi:putative salt-induced outer membrane protein YdiY
MAYNEIRETDVETKESNAIAVVRASTEYFWQITENAKFSQNLSSEMPFDGKENRKTKAESTLTSKITSSLALKVSLVVDHNSRVSETTENTDTQTAVTMVYSF